MVKVEIEFNVGYDVYGECEILDCKVETFKKELELANLQKVADYLVDDLYNDINDYLKDKDNSSFYFKYYPDTEEGFKYMCDTICIKIDGKVITKDDYNRIMEEPFED